MDIQMVIFNGLGLGLERRKFAPFWGDFGEGFDIYYHCGIEITFLCLRLKIGSFYDAEELVEELGDS
jgi:hypothetical protein